MNHNRKNIHVVQLHLFKLPNLIRLTVNIPLNFECAIIKKQELTIRNLKPESFI